MATAAPCFLPLSFLALVPFPWGLPICKWYPNDILQLKQTNYLFPLQQCAFSWVSMNKRVWQQPRLNEFGLVFPPSLTLSLSLSLSIFHNKFGLEPYWPIKMCAFFLYSWFCFTQELIYWRLFWFGVSSITKFSPESVLLHCHYSPPTCWTFV